MFSGLRSVWTSWRSCKTAWNNESIDQTHATSRRSTEKRRTRNAGQQLPGELLNMRSGERVKLVVLEKVIDTHAEELGDDADMITMVESLDQVDAFPAS